MIEYTLISSILNKICEMMKKPLEYSKDDTKLDPLRHLLKIKTLGIKWKKGNWQNKWMDNMVTG